MLDVWFDFGFISYFVVDVCLEFVGYVVDMYLEGFDQYCGWFMFFLMISVVMKGKVLYCQVLIYGFIVDGQGCKMFKFIGNIVLLQDVMNKLGVDILCLWVVFIDYIGEMVVFDEILKCVVDSYCCICNIVCFLLVNFNGFNLVIDMVKLEEMVVLDRWVVGCVKMVQ